MRIPVDQTQTWEVTQQAVFVMLREAKGGPGSQDTHKKIQEQWTGWEANKYKARDRQHLLCHHIMVFIIKRQEKI